MHSPRGLMNVPREIRGGNSYLDHQLLVISYEHVEISWACVISLIMAIDATENRKLIVTDSYVYRHAFEGKKEKSSVKNWDTRCTK